MNIYVASSWRNTDQPRVVRLLREAGHEVYDFRNPEPGDSGFHWSEIDPQWKKWNPCQFRAYLTHPVADRGFNFDMAALRRCDACLLVMPCGRSAHLELGWAIGAGKRTCILLSDGEPELMYKIVDEIVIDMDEVLKWLREVDNPKLQDVVGA